MLYKFLSIISICMHAASTILGANSEPKQSIMLSLFAPPQQTPIVCTKNARAIAGILAPYAKNIETTTYDPGYICLSGNNIEQLPTQIGQISSISSLCLQENQIALIPSEIGLMTQLSQLDMYENELISIPDELGRLTNMRALDFSKNSLLYIPDTLSNLKDLERLDLSHNQLHSIPDIFSEFASLEFLILDHNKLESLPSSISKLTNLRKLLINNNKIKALNFSMRYLGALQILDASNNKLEAIPRGIYNLTELEELNLSSNEITIIPTAISRMTSLTNLQLEDNVIESVPSSMSTLVNLQYLNLKKNCLPEFKINLPSIYELKLGENKIKEISEELCELTTLNNLDISGNSIESMGNISDMKSLRDINLVDNNIENIPENISNLSKLQTLSIYGNNINSFTVLTTLTNLHGLAHDGEYDPKIVDQVTQNADKLMAIEEERKVRLLAEREKFKREHPSSRQVLTIGDNSPDLKQIKSHEEPLQAHAQEPHALTYYNFGKEVMKINKQDEDGYTQLIIAIRDGDDELAKDLIDEGADVAICSKDKKNALHYAAKYNDVDIMKELLKDKKALRLINAQDNNGNTPLHSALSKRHHGLKAVAMLLLEGADFTICNNNGLRALELLSEKELEKIEMHKINMLKTQSF